MVKPLVPPAVDVLGPYLTTPQSVSARPGRTGDSAGAGFSWWKDCTDENSEDGTPIPAESLNNFKAQFVTAFQAAGLTIDDDRLLALVIQSGALNFAMATGTANAWTVGPSLAPLAYSAGLHFDIVAPATNTSTVVNVNVAGLGNRRLKKRDGASDPAVGDLVGGTLYRTVDDGTFLRIEGLLPSDLGETVAAQQMAHVIGSVTTLWPFNTLTTVAFTPERSLFRDPATTFVGGVLTVGPKDAGLWQAGCWSNLQRTDTTLNWIYIVKNGTQQKMVSGDTGAGSASGSNASGSKPVLLASGDTLRIQVLQQNGGSASQTLIAEADMFRLSA